MHEALVNNLRSYMHKTGLTSRELARRAQVRPSFIYDILSGKSSNPSSLRLDRVAKTLGVTIGELLEEEVRAYVEGTGISPGMIQSLLPIDATAPGKLQLQPFRGSNQPLSLPSTDPTIYFSSGWLYQHFGVLPEQIVMFEMPDDGMAPTLMKYDSLLIDRSQLAPAPEGLFVLFDGAQLTVRRVAAVGQDKEKGMMVSVSADATDHAPIECRFETLEMLGRVLSIFRLAE